MACICPTATVLTHSCLFCVFQALKVLRTADFSPFVVFIAAPTVASFNEVTDPSEEVK